MTRFLWAISTVFWLAACQTGSAPVDSASDNAGAARISTPPPRSVDGIIAAIKNSTPSEALTDRARRWRELADQPIDPSLSPNNRAIMLIKRSQSRFRIGHYEGAAGDLKQANEMGPLAGSGMRWGLHAFSIAVYDAAGYVNSAIEKAMSAQKYTGRMFAIPLLAKYGDRDNAHKMLELLKRQTGYSKSSGINTRWREYRQGFLEHGIAVADGRWADAEKAVSKTLNFPADIRFLPNANMEMALRYLTTLQRQGRLIDAEKFARELIVQNNRDFGKTHPNTSRAVIALGDIMMDQGRFEDASKLYAFAKELLLAVGADEASAVISKVTLRQGRAYLSLGHYEQGASLIREARRGFKHWPDDIYARVNGIVEAAATLRLGDFDRAKTLTAIILPEFEDRLGADHPRTLVAQGLAGAALARGSDTGTALTMLRAAIGHPAFLEFSQRDIGARQNKWIVETILEEYLDLLARLSESDAEKANRETYAAESFLIGNMLRARSVNLALAASLTRTAAGDGPLAQAVREEQDISREIGVLETTLTSLLSSNEQESGNRRFERLKSRAAELRMRHRQIADRLSREFPRYAELSNPRPATLERTAARLGATESLIAYYIGARDLFVWAVSRKGVRFVRKPGAAERVALLASHLRRAVDPRPRTLSDIPPFDVVASNELYNLIFAPVSDVIGNHDHLFAVKHGALGLLPLALLVSEPIEPPSDTLLLFDRYKTIPWFAKRHAVTALPAVSALDALRGTDRPQRSKNRLLAFADPVFDRDRKRVEGAQIANRSGGATAEVSEPGISIRNTPYIGTQLRAGLGDLPPLPDTADEVRGIAATLGADAQRSLYLGEAATETQVKTARLDAAETVIFATHGLVAGELDGLAEPALALSAPDEESKEDGLLTMSEILDLRLNADLVVLSACNTALGDGRGAEAVSGLGRSFFYAGTRGLLVSNWPVHSHSAGQLTTDIFARRTRQRGGSYASVLRDAMMAMVKDGQQILTGNVGFSYAHPLFWAPFSIVGDPG